MKAPSRRRMVAALPVIGSWLGRGLGAQCGFRVWGLGPLGPVGGLVFRELVGLSPVVSGRCALQANLTTRRFRV